MSERDEQVPGGSGGAPGGPGPEGGPGVGGGPAPGNTPGAAGTAAGGPGPEPAAGFGPGAPTLAFGPVPPSGSHGSAGVQTTRTGRIVLATVVVMLLMATSAVVGGVVGAFTVQQFRPTPTEVTRVVDAPQLGYTSLASIASQVGPSVVAIRLPNGAQGSGVVMDTDGHILTNAHVIATAQGGQVRVSFSNGDVAVGTVVGLDTRSDIGVVQVRGVKDLTPAAFGDSDELLVGDTVLAIGSPLGFEGTVTQGIISALDRTLTLDSPRRSLSGLIQTDASINPGNSGGALVNMAGEVVGINTAIATAGGESRGFIGVGFAVPANRALDVAEAIIAGEEVSHPYLGVEVVTATDGGALIRRVIPGGPAALAGLRVGDVVVRVGDRRISDSNDLVSAVQSARVGDRLEFEIVREGDRLRIQVQIGELDD